MYKQIYTDKSPPESLNKRIDYYTESEERDKQINRYLSITSPISIYIYIYIYKKMGPEVVIHGPFQ